MITSHYQCLITNKEAMGNLIVIWDGLMADLFFSPLYLCCQEIECQRRIPYSDWQTKIFKRRSVKMTLLHYEKDL